MKRAIRFTVFTIGLLSLCAFSWLHTKAYPSGESACRLTLRLSELGYLTVPEALTDEQALDDAMERFVEVNGANADVYAVEARPVWQETSVTPVRAVLRGQAVPWEQANQELAEGASYVVTGSDNGAMLHARLVSAVDYALFETASVWDAVMLTDYFQTEPVFGRRPVIVVIGETRAAGALGSCSLAEAKDISQEGALRFRVYFTAVSGQADGIVDRETAAALAFAGGES